MTTPGKLLLALQFWNGDKEQAMKVARLIADLEPRHSEYADFLFVSRFDCSHDKKTLDHVSRKFNVYSHISRRREVGWPGGCNGLFFGTMDWIYSVNEAKRFPTYRAILTFEADAVPLSPNWISELSREWDRAQPAKMVGAFQTNPAPHLNGNALFSGDIKFLKTIARDIGGCSPMGGWDFILRDTFRRLGWKDSRLFRSWWGYPTTTIETYDQLLREGVVFFHGCKDDSVVKLVRSRFSLQ